jgi:hypothetical protein
MRQCAVTLGIVVVALLSGGAATRQAMDVQPSGFLADARALLRPGTAAEDAWLVSRHPAADRPLLEPVTIWRPTAERVPAPRGAWQRRADGYSALPARTRSREYTLVEAPAPGTPRLQAAVTPGEAPRTALVHQTRADPEGVRVGPGALGPGASTRVAPPRR